nr:hypothetical protein [Tanacetum cinerariifolium]
RTVAVTTEDIQKRRNVVKARTTLLLALPDEHQLRFSKYKTAQELWAAILKTFGGNEATKKAMKNQLKQQYGNFKAGCLETLEQTFNRLQAIISHLEFIDVEIKQDDLNQKFLTSIAPEWLMYTIMWRNRSDLDTMSLDDVYNHLKVYEPEVQKKSESNSQNMAFISSAKNSSGNGEVNTASIPLPALMFLLLVLMLQLPVSVLTLLNMALLSMRANKFWKKTRKKISIQEVPTVSVPTGSGLVSTASPIFTTASVATPYARRKDGLDRGNEQIAKHLHDYEQAAAELTIGERIEQVNELVKYQDHHSKILKYQAQQRKPLSKKQKKEFYMLVLKSHAGWKTKHFKGMSLEEIKEKFIPVWKQIEDFEPMAFKEEGERFKRKGLMLEHSNAKKMKTSKEVSEEDLKAMMQLVPVEEIIRLGGSTAVYQFFVDMLNNLDREDLNQLWTLVKETLSIRQATGDKEKELWVELKRLYEPDVEDQLWTQTQALMHDPVE